MDKPVFVVPDAHGNAELVRGLLEQEGIVEPGWSARTDTDVFVLQLGDLANCVASSSQADLEALGLVHSGLINQMLIGNHEHPYFGGTPFAGFFPVPEVKESLYRIRDRDGLKVAYEAHGVLVTHAGVGPWARKQLGTDDPAVMAERLNHNFDVDPRHHLFNVVGKARRGWNNEGGILWADWSEPKPRKLKQVIGHSVGDAIRIRWQTRCIDLGAGKDSSRIAGAWIRPGGEVQTVIYDKNATRIAA